MADPLSVIGLLLPIATAGVQSTRSLHAAARRYKNRDAILRRILEEVGDTEKVLSALEQLLHAITTNPSAQQELSIADLLLGPIEKCSKLCEDFQVTMEEFGKKSKTDLIDWTKMEFKKGDINEFMDSVARYKATITVGLGVLTMRSAKMSHQALEEYDNLVKGTITDLQLRLQRIDDRVHMLSPESARSEKAIRIDLNDERQVTEQCLRICQDAKSYFESLASRDATLLQDVPQKDSSNIVRDRFEAQILTRQVFDDNQTSFAKIITTLRERLESIIINGNGSERVRLQEDIQASTQCLEVCKMASNEVATQKIHIIGEVVADGESDHVVVTTLADMFNVGKAVSKNKSALLVGSMSDEALIQLSHDRYNSRFGARDTEDHVNKNEMDAAKLERSERGLSSGRDEAEEPPRDTGRPSSNETRKRVGNSETLYKNKSGAK